MKKHSRAEIFAGIVVGIALLLFYMKDYTHLLDSDYRRDRKESKNVSVEEFLETRLLDGAERIYLESYYINARQMSEIWLDVLYSHPELFFVDSSYHYATWYNHILYLEPEYTFSQEKLLFAKKHYSDGLAAYLDPVDPAWSDLEKALYLHDQLALNCQYDTAEFHYTAYDIFTSKQGVCQAYALAYQALLEESGIPCRYVASEEMNHAWTEVCLDGTWYHVDPTYDDPVFDRRGHVQHTFFLKSDDAMQETHTGADAPYSCDSTAYDNALWNDVTSAFIPVDGVFYCISGNQICRWDGDTLTPLHTISDLWYVIDMPYSYWDGCFSALGTDGTDLLYNTPREVRRYELSTGKSQTLYTYEEAWRIYGFTYRDGLLTCQVAPDPNSPGETVKVLLTEQGA